MNCAAPLPCGWGRRSRQPEPPRRTGWGFVLGVVFVLGTTMFVVVAIRGILR